MPDYVAFARELVESGYPYRIIRYGDGHNEMRDWEAAAVQEIVAAQAPQILVEIRPIDRRRLPIY